MTMPDAHMEFHSDPDCNGDFLALITVGNGVIESILQMGSESLGSFMRS